MKICVLGLDCAAPEIVFGDLRLPNLRRLMGQGVYGRLCSVIPPITVPAWMCMSCSQDPGSLGVYGFRNRSNHSYNGLEFANSASIKAPAIWDFLAQHGKKSIVMGVPPNYPPRRINGISIGDFLTPDTVKNDFTFPPSIKARITELIGEYPADVKNFRSGDKASLKEQIFEMNRKHWRVVRWLLTEQQWDYFHFVDIGLDRMHHGFWNYFDRGHVRFEPGNAYENAIPEYYSLLDEQIGSVLDLLDQDTIVLVVSDHGAQRLDGGFAINQWLVREGLLVLNQYPDAPTPLERLNVNWNKTRVWSEGGYYARMFFNMQGREPYGVVAAAEYESFQNEMKARLELLPDDKGGRLGTEVFKPKEIYRHVRNVAPDLIVHLGGLYWRSIGTVGHSRIHLRENDSGPDGCNHSQYGIFILSSPNCHLRGELEGANLLDIAPTLLDLAGYQIPEIMQGHTLLAAEGQESNRTVSAVR
jgi:predicted AlkP superfamily phosphohydrolase/phosphomutase